MCRGEEEAKNVLSQSEGIFKNNSIESLPIINYNFNEKTISQLLKNLDFSLSIGEAKKLIRGGGVKIDDEKVLEENLDISTFKQFKLSIGKKKHFLIKIK
jgi:tyrosyl-tRNA synthetase